MHGYKGESTTSKPSTCMCRTIWTASTWCNVVDRVSGFGSKYAYFKQHLRDKHMHHIGQHGRGLPEIRDWKWRVWRWWLSTAIGINYDHPTR